MSFLFWLKNRFSSNVELEKAAPQAINNPHPPATTRDEVEELLNYTDESVVLVEAQWFSSLQLFIAGGPKPEKMLTSLVITKKKKLRKGLKLGQDYFFLYKSLWERLNDSDSETITLDANKKLTKLDFLSIAEEHKKLLLNQCQETSRFDPVDLQLPETVPRNETVVNLVLNTDHSDIKKESESTGQTTVGLTESENSHSKPMRGLQGRVGLANPGLFCYMNAGLQCLLSMPLFIDCMVKEFHSGNLDHKEASSLVVKLIMSISLMKAGVVKPAPLWAYVSRTFPTNKQHDMPEFLRFLVEQIENELGEENSISNSVLNGVLCSNVTCHICLNSSKKLEKFIDLQIDQSDSVEKSLRFFTQDELLGNMYYCEVCKTKTQALKSFSIAHPPNYLVLQVKRFRQAPSPHKLNFFIRYRRRMTVSAQQKDCYYELLAVGVHIGSINSGHYVAYVKKSRTWYCFDDSTCSKVPIKCILGQQAYLLVYKLL